MGSYNVYKTILNGSDVCRISNFSADLYMFTHLEINKSGNDVSLKSHVQVLGNLTLTNYDLILSFFNLTIGPSDSGIIIGGSTSSYLQADGMGRVIKQMDASTPLPTSVNFAVGDFNDFSPTTLMIDAATYSGNDWIGVNLTDAIHPDEIGTHYLSRYWNWTSSGFSTITYNLLYNYVDADIVGDELQLLSARWTGLWNSFIFGDPMSNTLMTDVGLNVPPIDNDFTGSNGGTPMPISLLSLDASVMGKKVVVSWSTASEVNNDYFTLERFIDAGEPEMLASVQGAGNSIGGNNYTFIDNNPMQGTSYYRLKQTDYDGTSTQFDPVAVKFGPKAGASIRIYPNPVQAEQEINVELTGFDKGNEILVIMINQYGVEVFSKIVIQDGAAILTAIDTKKKLPPGLYFVTGSSNHNIYRQKLIIR